MIGQCGQHGQVCTIEGHLQATSLTSNLYSQGWREKNASLEVASLKSFQNSPSCGDH